MGFGILWGPPSALPIQRAATELRLGAFGFSTKSSTTARVA
jgi:hypothetical protein